MRKPILFVSAVAAFSIMVMSAVSLAMTYSAETPQAPAAESVQTPEAVTRAPLSGFETQPKEKRADETYLVREQDGVIVVCRPETPDIPEQITDIEVAALRLRDQMSLAEGIPVTGQEALLRLLEDFGP